MFKTITMVVLVGVLFFTSRALAIMSSTNYYIYADTVGNGGQNSTSTNYSVDDSIGESAGGITTSTSYIVRGGYQGAEFGDLSIAVSASSVSLGTLSSAAVASGSSIVTITANSTTGYSLSIGSVSGTGLTAVADGTVTAGSEEYGVAVSGSDKSFATDQAVTGGLLLAASSAPVTASQTTLTFKASVSSGSSAASYSQTITLAASANI